MTTLGFSCGMWDLVPWPGIEPRPCALEAWSLSHWTAREIPWEYFFLSIRQWVKWMLVVKNLLASAGDIRDMGLIPGSGRSPGGGHGNPLQYSCLENPVGRGAWQAAVHGVTQSQLWPKRLSTHAKHIRKHQCQQCKRCSAMPSALNWQSGYYL